MAKFLYCDFWGIQQMHFVFQSYPFKLKRKASMTANAQEIASLGYTWIMTAVGSGIQLTYQAVALCPLFSAEGKGLKY